jgi:hypothetical protein
MNNGFCAKNNKIDSFLNISLFHNCKKCLKNFIIDYLDW